MKLKTLLVAAVMTAMPVAAYADDITDNMDRARQSYDNGSLTEAKRALDMAAGLITQKLGQAMLGFLPAAMDGWTSTDGDANAMAMTMFGGGMAAQRSYNNQSGADVKIDLMADSPMMATMSMMMSNPQIAMSSGATFKTIGGQQAMITADGQIQFMIVNRYFITVSGGATPEEKEAYAGAIDFNGLANFK